MQAAHAGHAPVSSTDTCSNSVEGIVKSIAHPRDAGKLVARIYATAGGSVVGLPRKYYKAFKVSLPLFTAEQWRQYDVPEVPLGRLIAISRPQPPNAEVSEIWRKACEEYMRTLRTSRTEVSVVL